jgi:hypothetical protein
MIIFTRSKLQVFILFFTGYEFNFSFMCII